MDFILGIILAPYAWVALFILAVLFDHNDARGWSGFIVVALIALLTWGLQPPWQYALGGALVWVPVGLGWSMWRWRRHCGRVLKKVKSGDITKNEGLRRVNSKDHTPTIVYWVLAWPISLIEMLFSDIINMIEVLITKVFKGTYAKIASDTSDKINDVPERK